MWRYNLDQFTLLAIYHKIRILNAIKIVSIRINMAVISLTSVIRLIIMFDLINDNLIIIVISLIVDFILLI